MAANRPYVRLQLTQETTAVIATEQLQEVLVLESDRLTTMPNLPPWIMGLLNQRSRIFWVLDLPNFLGLTAPESQPEASYNIVMIRVNQKALGLRLHSVKGIIRFAPEQIQSPVGVVPGNLEPYLGGCIVYESEILLVLEAAAIVQGASLQLQAQGN